MGVEQNRETEPPYPSPDEQAKLLESGAYKQHKYAKIIDLFVWEAETFQHGGDRTNFAIVRAEYEWAKWMKTGGFQMSDRTIAQKLVEFQNQYQEPGKQAWFPESQRRPRPSDE